MGVAAALGMGVVVGTAVGVGVGAVVGTAGAVGMGADVGTAVAVGTGVVVGIAVAVGIGAVVEVALGVAVGLATTIGVAVPAVVGDAAPPQATAMSPRMNAAKARTFPMNVTSDALFEAARFPILVPINLEGLRSGIVGRTDIDVNTPARLPSRHDKGQSAKRSAGRRSACLTKETVHVARKLEAFLDQFPKAAAAGGPHVLKCQNLGVP